MKLLYWTVSLQLLTRLRERRAARRLNASDWFDASWYLSANPDVAAVPIDPALHYLRYGFGEGRAPHPFFDGRHYLANNGDVRAAGRNPFDHFVSSGAGEGRSPHPLFDVEYYLRMSPECVQSGEKALHHYLERGASEGRNPHPLFDTRFYLEHSPDVGAEGINPLLHFVEFGGHQGRDPHPLFDVDFYLRTNPELQRTHENPLCHYLRVGAAPDRPPHPLFDPGAYRRSHPEARDANPLEHFITKRGADRFEALGRRLRLRGVSARERSRAAVDDPLVVCVAHVLPYPPRAGNEYRIHRYLRWLESRGYQTLMVCCPLPGEESEVGQLERAAEGISNLLYCDHEGEILAFLEPHLAPLVAELDGRIAFPVPWDSPDAPGLADYELSFCPDVLVHLVVRIAELVPRPLGVITSYVFNTRFLPYLDPGVLKLVDTIDVFSSKTAKVCSFGINDLLALPERAERALLLRADGVIAIQPDESRALSALVPERPVIEVGIDFDPRPVEMAALPGSNHPPTLFCVGSSNPLNCAGLRGFIRFAWPWVLREHPEALLVVAGAVSDTVPADAPRVRACGIVPDLDELYRSCDLVINPAVAGTGLKIKSLEALCHWRPLVTWPAGVDGLPPELLRHCSVATDWYGFHLGIVKRLSARGVPAFTQEDRERIAEALGPSWTYRALEEILERHLRPAESASRGWSESSPVGGSR